MSVLWSCCAAGPAPGLVIGAGCSCLFELSVLFACDGKAVIYIPGRAYAAEPLRAGWPGFKLEGPPCIASIVFDYGDCICGLGCTFKRYGKSCEFSSILPR